VRPVAGTVPAPRIVGVKRLADYLKRKLEGDTNLRSVAVRGEVSNLSIQASGTLYFVLKEGVAVLRCVAWASDAANFTALKDGLAVVARGSISTHEQRSVYQLVVKDVTLEGVGDVHALFEDRKKRLAAEGLFEVARKRALPAFPFRVALVSSRAANGAIDFVTLLRHRAPHVGIVWCETSVQGPNAPAEICTALRRASRADVDLIVVTRGGGSFEDLFAFSDEQVVRAVARARHPVISAIGHTADQQLSDFAADVHLETPSAAAKAIGLDTRQLYAHIDDTMTRARANLELRIERLGNRLGRAVRSKLAEPRLFLMPLAQRLGDADAALAATFGRRVRERERHLRDLGSRLAAHDPSARLAERERSLHTASLKLDAAFRARSEAARRRMLNAETRLLPATRALVERRGGRLTLARAHLDGKNPEAILQRGYAIVTYGDAIVRDSAMVPHGARIEARLARGTLSALVETAREEKGSDGH